MSTINNRAILCPIRPSEFGHSEIFAVFHYLPLHLSPMGRTFGGREGDCPVTEQVVERLLRLPFYSGMTDSEQTQVIDAVRAFRCQ